MCIKLLNWNWQPSGHLYFLEETACFPGISSRWMFRELDSRICPIIHCGSYTILGLNFPISEVGIKSFFYLLLLTIATIQLWLLLRLVYVELNIPMYMKE